MRAGELREKPRAAEGIRLSQVASMGERVRQHRLSDQLALLGGVPPESARATFAGWLGEPLPDNSASTSLRRGSLPCRGGQPGGIPVRCEPSCGAGRNRVGSGAKRRTETVGAIRRGFRSSVRRARAPRLLLMPCAGSSNCRTRSAHVCRSDRNGPAARGARQAIGGSGRPGALLAIDWQDPRRALAARARPGRRTTSATMTRPRRNTAMSRSLRTADPNFGLWWKRRTPPSND